MAQGWDFYVCQVNDAPAVIFLNLGLRDTAPQPERPHLLWVWVKLLNPQPNGLPWSEEAGQLHELEDRLKDTLADRLDAVYVGRTTTSGRQEFYYYVPAITGWQEAIREAMSRYPAYASVPGHENDPDWSQYLQFLYPREHDLQRIENRRVVEVLEEQGDPLHAPREVDHYLSFPSSTAASAGRPAGTRSIA